MGREQGEDPLRCLGSGCARVEARAERTQGLVELGGEEEDEERLLEGELAIEQAQADGDRHHRRADRRDQLEHERREEGHAQDPHRRRAEALADLRDRGDLLAAAAEELQRGQALQDVEEVGAQAAEGLPLLAGQGVGQAADQDHEEGEKGGGEEQDDAGERIAREDEGQDGERDQDGQRQMGQILAEVGVKGVDSFGHDHGQLAGALCARVERAKGEEVSEKALAQGQLDVSGDLDGGRVAAVGSGRAGEDREE